MTIQQVLLAGGVTPTYATWNPSDKAAAVALSGGNLTATMTPASGNNAGVRATLSKTSGKWYWEITKAAGGFAGALQIGAAEAGKSLTTNLDNTPPGTDSISVWVDAGGASVVFSVLMDLDSNIINVWADGVDQVVNKDMSGVTGGAYPIINCSSTGASTSVVSTTNFGASAFAYTMPAGYQRLFT